MSRLPLFQGISIPQGIQARLSGDIVYLKSVMSDADYQSLMSSLLNTIATQTGTQVNQNFPPVLLSAASTSDGAKILLTFDKVMANPSGKHAQFSVKVNGNTNIVVSSYLNADPTIIELTLTSQVSYGQIITTSYTQGTIIDSIGLPLASFSLVSTTNNAPSLYQVWGNYPVSPVLTSNFPNQFIRRYATEIVLFCSVDPCFVNALGPPVEIWGGPGWCDRYYYANGIWNLQGHNFYNVFCDEIKEANNPIYTNSGKTAIYFDKTI